MNQNSQDQRQHTGKEGHNVGVKAYRFIICRAGKRPRTPACMLTWCTAQYSDEDEQQPGNCHRYMNCPTNNEVKKNRNSKRSQVNTNDPLDDGKYPFAKTFIFHFV